MNVEKLFKALEKIIGDRENVKVKFTVTKRGDKSESVPPSK